MLTLTARAVVRQITLPGTDTTYHRLPDVPVGTQAADVQSTVSWQIRSDPGVAGFVVPPDYDKHLPGAFVRDLWFQGNRTYQVIFYVG